MNYGMIFLRSAELLWTPCFIIFYFFIHLFFEHLKKCLAKFSDQLWFLNCSKFWSLLETFPVRQFVRNMICFCSSKVEIPLNGTKLGLKLHILIFWSKIDKSLFLPKYQRNIPCWWYSMYPILIHLGPLLHLSAPVMVFNY